MNRRRLLFGGAGVVLVALAVAGSEFAGGLFPVEQALSALGNDYALAAALGVGALVIAAVVVKRGDLVDQTRMPDPESATSVPAPGDPFDETLDDWRLAVPFAGRERKQQVRDRLHDVAVEAVRQSRSCDAATARQRVESGAWIDDSHAAAFLDDDRSPSLRARLEATLHGDSWFVYAARRTAGAIAHVGSTGAGRTAGTDGSATTTESRPDRPEQSAGRVGSAGPRSGGAAPAPAADGGTATGRRSHDRHGERDRAPDRRSGDGRDPTSVDGHDPTSGDGHDPTSGDGHDPTSGDGHDPAAGGSEVGR